MDYVTIIPDNSQEKIFLGRFPQLPITLAQRLSTPLVPHLFAINIEEAQEYLSEKYNKEIRIERIPCRIYEANGNRYYDKEDLDCLNLEEILKPQPQIIKKPLRRNIGSIDSRFLEEYEKEIQKTGIPKEDFYRLLQNKISYMARKLIVRIPTTLSHEVCDFESYGWIAVLEGLKRYDPERGVRFTTYIEPSIRGAMIDSLRKQDPINRRTRILMKQKEELKKNLTLKLGRPPNDIELAKIMGIEIERLQELIEIREMPLDDNDKAEKGENPLDLTSRLIDRDEQEEMISRVRKIISTLPTKKREIMRLHYEQGLNLEEIAFEKQITPSRVSQILKQERLKIKRRIEKES